MTSPFTADAVASVRRRLDANHPSRTAFQRVIHDRFLAALSSPRDVHVVAPRRFGKTTAVQMFVAALLDETDARVGIVTPVSERGMRAIRDGIPSANAFGERLIIASHHDADQLRSASAAHVVIFDEAALLSDDMVQGYVLPLMGARDTIVFATSTPLGKGTYAAMLALKNAWGEPLCQIVVPRTEERVHESRL